MNIINQSVELIEELPLKTLELAGRISHKSENRITHDSYKSFLKQMLSVGHTATLEFASVYIKIKNFNSFILEYGFENEYSIMAVTDFKWCTYCYTINKDGDVYVYTNLRFLLDNFSEIASDFIHNEFPEGVNKFIPMNKDPYKRYCFKVICNRGVSHEFVRHRLFSFLQESTRYCNYSKDKFSNELNIINPFNNFINTNKLNEREYICLLNDIQNIYLYLTSDKNSNKLKAQEARGILPNDLKTELYVVGYLKDWIGEDIITYNIDIFDETIEVTNRKGFNTLRSHPSAHPQMREISDLIENIIIEKISISEFNNIKNTFYQ